MLRLGIALVAVDSYKVVSRHTTLYLCLRRVHAPRMILNPDHVSGEAFLDPNPSVVWQNRSASMMHRHQPYKRFSWRSKRALGAL
jgi:hypothetical protein